MNSAQLASTRNQHTTSRPHGPPGALPVVRVASWKRSAQVIASCFHPSSRAGYSDLDSWIPQGRPRPRVKVKAIANQRADAAGLQRQNGMGAGVQSALVTLVPAPDQDATLRALIMSRLDLTSIGVVCWFFLVQEWPRVKGRRDPVRSAAGSTGGQRRCPPARRTVQGGRGGLPSPVSGISGAGGDHHFVACTPDVS